MNDGWSRGREGRSRAAEYTFGIKHVMKEMENERKEKGKEKGKDELY